MSAVDVDAVVATLERTPTALRAMLGGLPADLTHATEGGESWSPFDVLGHLIHGEKTDWIPRLRIILAAGQSQPFEPFDRFAQFEASRGNTVEDLLGEFEAHRTANLETLRGMLVPGIDLDAEGTHPELGRVTAGELLATWATHDLGHVAQVARVMAKHFGRDAGPWRAYLPILGDRG
ncbi:MAG: DinB family protein [Gemmatimonadetes bacterium]|nr:DinB family protein [Gemmatimonadota bacterium]MCK5482770.1 DinB family protein [Gemmatimonadota bacterium]